MEKKGLNKYIIFYLCLLIVLIGFTIYKLIINHEEKLYDVLYSEIEYKAKRCYLEKKCDESFTLNDLYVNGYLETMFDPVSKEEVNKDLIIKVNKNEVIIDK